MTCTPVALFLYGIGTRSPFTLLPTAIAFSRKKKHRWLIAVMNTARRLEYPETAGQTETLWLTLAHEWPFSHSRPTAARVLEPGRIGLGARCRPLPLRSLGAGINLKKEGEEGCSSLLLHRLFRRQQSVP